MAEKYFVSTDALGWQHDNEADALRAAKEMALDRTRSPAAHVHIFKLVAEVNGKDPLQLEVKHYGP